VDIGRPKRIIEIEPIDLPLPALEPMPEPMPQPAPVQEPQPAEPNH